MDWKYAERKEVRKRTEKKKIKIRDRLKIDPRGQWIGTNRRMKMKVKCKKENGVEGKEAKGEGKRKESHSGSQTKERMSKKTESERERRQRDGGRYGGREKFKNGHRKVMGAFSFPC